MFKPFFHFLLIFSCIFFFVQCDNNQTAPGSDEEVTFDELFPPSGDGSEEIAPDINVSIEPAETVTDEEPVLETDADGDGLGESIDPDDAVAHMWFIVNKDTNEQGNTFTGPVAYQFLEGTWDVSQGEVLVTGVTDYEADTVLIDDVSCNGEGEYGICIVTELPLIQGFESDNIPGFMSQETKPGLDVEIARNPELENIFAAPSQPSLNIQNNPQIENNFNPSITPLYEQETTFAAPNHEPFVDEGIELQAPNNNTENQFQEDATLEEIVNPGLTGAETDIQAMDSPVEENTGRQQRQDNTPVLRRNI